MLLRNGKVVIFKKKNFKNNKIFEGENIISQIDHLPIEENEEDNEEDNNEITLTRALHHPAKKVNRYKNVYKFGIGISIYIFIVTILWYFDNVNTWKPSY